MTTCNAIGALTVGGRVVGAVRCGLDARHVTKADASDMVGRIRDGVPLDATPHRAVLEWNIEAEPDLDLFDPAEHFDVEIPAE